MSERPFSVDKIAYEAVGRMVRDSLYLTAEDGLEAFWSLSVVLRAKLSPAERQALAWAGLMACDDDEALGVARAVLEENGSGWPPPLLLAPIEEATAWYDLASYEEIKAFTLAGFMHLSREDQADFLAFARARIAA